MPSNPVSITIPPNLNVVIDAQTNAFYRQPIFLTDTSNEAQYLLSGQGEDGEPMDIDKFSDGHLHVPDGRLELTAIGTRRTLIFRCKYQKPGEEEALQDSAVKLETIDLESEGVTRWAIATEDGVDGDFNDGLITVTATQERLW